MRLIGNYLSPYVRRVAVSLNILEWPFELDEVFVFKDPAVVRRYNPLVRIPVLVLDDGSKLFESGAILDEIDRLAVTDRCLTPSEGLQRRRVVCRRPQSPSRARRRRSGPSMKVACDRRRSCPHPGSSTTTSRSSLASSTWRVSQPRSGSKV